MRVTVKASDMPNGTKVFVPEENDGAGRYYEAGETFELAAERARKLIDLGYVDEAKPVSTKKES